jgi:hypothetical protein
MCAINPKQQHHFTLSVYTSVDMEHDEFMTRIAEKVMEAEQMLNQDMRLRWRIEEVK